MRGLKGKKSKVLLIWSHGNVCVCVRARVCARMRVHACACVCMCADASMHVFMCVFVYVLESVGVCVGDLVCVCW